jgi:hypothetical protein
MAIGKMIAEVMGQGGQGGQGGGPPPGTGAPPAMQGGLG